MRILKLPLLLTIIFILGCGKEHISDNLDDGINIVLNDEIIINHKDFDYYDYSSHLLYFKSDNPFAEYLNDIGDFDVYANGTKIYGGKIIPENRSDFIYMGPTIQPDNDYDDYILPVITYPTVHLNGDVSTDPREDIKIVDALKRYNQFHSGLTCDIKSINSFSNKVALELSIRNDDSFNYYYLDPEKMGVNLFHFYAGSPIILDTLSVIGGSNFGYGYNPTGSNGYFADIDIESPLYWNYWDIEWLSLIKSGETKSFILNYNIIKEISPGTYIAYFKFPGLNIQLSKEEIELEDGRIWQGNVAILKKVTIE